MKNQVLDLQDSFQIQEMRVHYFENELVKYKKERNTISRKIDIFEHQKLCAVSDLAALSQKANL